MKDTLLKVLDLTNYEGDKEEWSNQALGLISLNAYNALILSLPEEKKKEIEEKIKGEEGVKNLPQILTGYFSQEQINEQLEKSSIDFMEKYVENVFPKLPEDQQKAVEEFFNSATPAA